MAAPRRSIALLRGINVGGNRRLPMKELVRDLEALGAGDVATYIQSGNVAFDAGGDPAATWEERIASAIEERHGFRPRVVVLGPEALAAVVAACPYRAEGEAEPKSVHVFFLAAPATAADLEALAALAAADERFVLHDRAFYLHAPGGIGRSKLVERVEKLLGVEATARNWRTVEKLVAMAGVEV